MATVTTVIDNPPAFLTTAAEITYNLSAATVSYINSITADDDALWDWHIANASDVVLGYCQRFATLDQLAANRWARARATEIARNNLLTVDGEPMNAAFAKQAEKAEEFLQMVFEGKMDIPGLDVADQDGNELKGAGPAISNFAVDMQVPGGQVRVDRSCSGGNLAEGYNQRIDWRSGFGWR